MYKEKDSVLLKKLIFEFGEVTVFIVSHVVCGSTAPGNTRQLSAFRYNIIKIDGHENYVLQQENVIYYVLQLIT